MDKLGLMFLQPDGHEKSKFYESTDRNTSIDWCMTNNRTSQDHEHRLQIYESWFSDHKPLWLEIGDKRNFN